MNNGRADWHGNFTAVVTPFDRDGAVDEGKFRDNLELLIGEGIDGVVVSGCTGEAWALTPAERARLFRIAREQAGRRITVIGGAGEITTDQVIGLARAALEAGCDGTMILPPYYCLANNREVVAHYRAVSDAVDLPILLYNIPKRTGVNLTPELVAELAEIRSVVAIKESSNDFVQVERTLAAAGDRILVFSGHSAARGAAAIALGAVGFVSSMETQIMGREAVELYRAAKTGDLKRAREIQYRCLFLDDGLRSGVGTFPANLKEAMNMVGRPGGFPRRPLLPLTEAERAAARAVLTHLGLLNS